MGQGAGFGAPWLWLLIVGAGATPEAFDFLFRTGALGMELPELVLVDDWAPECS
jgi:hypothetical protein